MDQELNLEGPMCSRSSDNKVELSQTKPSELGLQLETLICSDNKQEFVSFLRSQPCIFSQTQLLKLLCSHRAIGCTSALLDGETGLTVDLNVPLEDEDGLTPLAIAASSLCYDLTDLFLKHGAETSLSGNMAQMDPSKLPLSLALDALWNHELMRYFTAGCTVYKFLSTFWLQELKEPLDTIKLLASRTKQVDRVALCCAEEWNILKVTALLVLGWDILNCPIQQFVTGQLALVSQQKKLDFSLSLDFILKILHKSHNFVEEYRTTSMLKHEVVPPEVAYKFLTSVPITNTPKFVFSATMDRLAAEIRLADTVLLQAALVEKMRSKSIIAERIYITPVSPVEEEVMDGCFLIHIRCAMHLDDRDEFVELVNEVGSFDPSYSKNEVVENVRRFMFAYDSANCAAAVLDGETDDIFNFNDLTDVDWSFLHKAAEYGSPKLIALFLENGFLADELNLQAELPLNVALKTIRNNYLLRDWKEENKSAIDLVMVLCHNRFRYELEMLRLLVLKTTDVSFEFLRYLKERKMVEVGALLMVGCKELLPSSFVVHSLVSKSPSHNVRVAGSVKQFSMSSWHRNLHEDDDPLERKGILLLVDIFNKIGDYLGAYVRLEENKDYNQIFSEIAWLLVRAGVSDTLASKVDDTPSRELYLADHERLSERGNHNRGKKTVTVEQHSRLKLLSTNMFTKQGAPDMSSKQRTSTVLPAHSLHTSALKVDANLAPSIHVKRLINVLQILRTPMPRVPIAAVLKRGLRCM